MLVHWIWLATRAGLGDRGRMALLKQFANAEDIYYGDAQRYDQLENLSSAAREALLDKSLFRAEQIIADCRWAHIQIITWQDAAYPRRLRGISDPPVVLYCRGQLPQVDALPLISVVGTRKATGYGITTAKRLGYQMACCGGVVVSGVAAGIDGAAMRGALSAGGTVIGVLGCGADVVYPASSQALFDDILQQGCLVTEFPPGTPPIASNFLRRNRIISGLSCGVLVVEAPEKSGALNTAEHASRQGRELFAVPGNIDMETCRGSNALLRDGATAVSSGWELLSEYADRFPGKIWKSSLLSCQPACLDEVEQQEEPAALKVAQSPRLPRQKRRKSAPGTKKEIDKGARSPYIDPQEALPPLSAEEEALHKLVCRGVTQVDELIARTGLEARRALSCLTMLQIKGLIRQLPGKQVALKYEIEPKME